jgi:glyoxylase-like metal-dependent hydrolase (beta-lactamase superfamily II)
VKVHHLSAASLCPLSARLVNGEGGLLAPARVVCHCWLIESDDGLVLVDTGIGTADIADVGGRLGPLFRHLIRPRSDPSSTARARIEALGFSRADVRHIIPTHLDLDHAGGFPDLPGARVHVYRPEHDAAMARRTAKERNRYRPHQLAGVSWVFHEADGQGEDWFGFRAVKPLEGLDIALVPLIGHTRGHCGVAVRGQAGWLLHCGDAYFHAGQMDPERERGTFGLRLFERVIAMDNRARKENLARLRTLARTERGQVTLFSAHDPTEFRALAAAPSARVFA